MDLLRAKMLEYIEKFPGRAFIAFLIVGLIWILAGISATRAYTPEQYEKAREYVINETPSLELCERLSFVCWEAMTCPSGDGVTYITVDEDNYEDLLATLNEYQYTLYVLYTFDRAMVEDGGIGYFLYDTDAIFADEISALLREIDFDSMADAYDDYIKKYNVDFQEFAIDVEEVHLETFYKNYRIQDLDEKYNLSEFNDTFSKLNGDDELIEHLAEYARNHIYEFNWYAIEDIWLEPYIE